LDSPEALKKRWMPLKNTHVTNPFELIHGTYVCAGGLNTDVKNEHLKQ